MVAHYLPSTMFHFKYRKFCLLILVVHIFNMISFLDSKRPRCTSENAYVTMATDDVTAIGALVLRQSLENSKTKACTVAMVTDRVSWIVRDLLESDFDHVVEVKPVNVKHLEGTPSPLFGKLRAWSLTNYTKIVYIHSDAIVLRNVDELFQYPELSAVPEGTWTDLFNSGVMVLKPAEKTLKGLLKMAKTEQSFDDTDQGTLNMYFSAWQSLPYIYNAAGDSPETAPGPYQRFGHRVRIVRFQADMKPWFVSFNLQEQQTEMFAGELGLIPVPRPFYEKWWRVFLKSVRSRIDRVLQSHNMEIVEDGPRVFLGDPYAGLHVRAGFFVVMDKSYPKFRFVGGRKVNNQYCTLGDVFVLSERELDARG